VAGSDQDHTGRTDTATCTQEGCHEAPWATETPTATGPSTTTAAPTTSVAIITPTNPPGGTPNVMTHPILGFDNCMTCHSIDGAGGSIYRVNDTHDCDECHASAPMPEYNHSYLPNDSCTICHEPA
jgi:hypothetical protein